jgi:hypothetical protein
MITFLFTLIPFVFIIYYLTTISKSKYVSSDLKSGEICYSCKEKMDIDKLEVLENLLNNKSNYRLCQSCKRDEKLDEIVNHSKLSKINKFKLYLISDRDVTLKVAFNIKGFSYFYNTFLVCYWLLLIYRHKLISVKK